MIQPQDDKKRIYNLSIYLLKDSVKNFDSALKSLAVSKFKLKEEFEVDGVVYLGKEKENVANWRELLEEGVEENLPDITSTSNRALLMIKINDRIFALPFGYGKHLLKDNVIDRDIALKTALNLIDADSLRSLDRANLENLGMLTKTQSSLKGKQENFNVDPIKDLLKGVTGGTDLDKQSLGFNITGNEGLYLNPNITFADIKTILEVIHTASSSLKYRQKFDWIDNLKQEKDPAIIELLQGFLLDDLIKNDCAKVILSPNMIIPWEVFEGISYTPKGDLQQDFSIESFYTLNNREIRNDWAHFQTFAIYFKFSNSEYSKKVPIWRCINYETIHEGFLYVLMDGIWYRINENYAKNIKDYAKNFKDSDLIFIDCEKAMDEGQFNTKMADSNLDYGLLDKKLIKTDHLRSEIELCDVLANNKELIHVKFYRDSAGLSHLFSQGRISANLLMKDESFRKNARTKLASLGISRDLIPIKQNDLVRGEYTITFAIIDNKKRSFIDTLPFFSLLNFRLTAEELTNWGYQVRVKKINIV